MATRIYFLCLAVTILIVSQSNAQSAISSVLMPGYTSPLYKAQPYTNQGLNLYQRNQKVPRGTDILGLTYFPKIFPNGIPNIPQVPQLSLTTGGKLKPLSGLPALLLNPQSLLPRVPQIQIRSTDGEAKNKQKEEKSGKSIDPIHQQTDELPKVVIGSSPTPSNATVTANVKNPKIRSPEYDGNAADAFDYLSKAANPSDEKESRASIGHMFKQVGSGIKHAVEKIDSAWNSASQSPSKPKESENNNDYMPYKAWSHNSENNPGSQKDSVADLMQEYMKMMNTGRNLQSQNPQYQIPDSVIVGMNNVLNEFKESLAKSSLMRKENSDSQNNNEDPHDDHSSKSFNGKFEHSPNNVPDFEKNQGKSGYNQYYQTPNGYGYQTNYYGNYQYPNGYYGNSPMPNPYNFGQGFYPGFNPPGMMWNSGYYQKSSSSDVSSSQPHEGTMVQPTSSRNYRQMPTNNFGGSSGALVNRALQLAQGIVSRDSSQITNAGVGLGSSIAGAANTRPISPVGLTHLPLFKRSYPPDNIWNSATGLAGNIANVATNPSQAGNGQILGSIGSIWNSASNLAGNIGQVGTNPSGVGNQQLVGSSSGAEYNPESYPSQSVWNSATDLAGNIAKIPTDPGENPVGSVWNSASNLAHSITKSPGGLGNLPNGRLLGASNAPESVVNTATDLASKIVDTAANPSSYGSRQTMTPYDSTYGSEYFPKSSPTGQIWNSASQLASSIANTATNPGVIGSGRVLYQPVGYSGLTPLTSIWNSASNLAGSISNVGTSPKSWTPFTK